MTNSLARVGVPGQVNMLTEQLFVDCTNQAVPTGNLDAETSSEVAALLRNASDMFGQTIVMVTHDRQMADFADRVLVIKDGIVR